MHYKVFFTLTIVAFCSYLLPFHSSAQNQDKQATPGLPQVPQLLDSLVTDAEVATQNNTLRLTTSNLVNTWIKLSITGRSQVEIESYLATVPENAISDTKKQLRQLVMTALMNRFHNSLNISSLDDIRTYRKAIGTIINYYGLEQDEQIKLIIRNNYGLTL